MNKRLKEAGILSAGTVGVLLLLGLILFLTGKGANKVSDAERRKVAALGTLSVADVSGEIQAKRGESAGKEETADGSRGASENSEIETDSGTSSGNESREENAARKEAQLSALRDRLRGEIDRKEVPEFSETEKAELRRFFGKTVFFGDSVTEAIASYGIVDAGSVIYKRGGTQDVLYPLLSRVREAYPERVVLFTGLNDCNHYLEDLPGYEADYKKSLDYLLETVPKENIVVLSLLPPSEAFGATRDDLRQAPVFDGRLREICGEKGVRYADIYWMVHQDYYLSDGIHFNEAFYRQMFRYLLSFLE